MATDCSNMARSIVNGCTCRAELFLDAVAFSKSQRLRKRGCAASCSAPACVSRRAGVRDLPSPCPVQSFPLGQVRKPGECQESWWRWYGLVHSDQMSIGGGEIIVVPPIERCEMTECANCPFIWR